MSSQNILLVTLLSILILSFSCSFSFDKTKHTIYPDEREPIIILGGIMLSQTGEYLEDVIDSLKKNHSVIVINIDKNLIDKALETDDALVFFSKEIESVRKKLKYQKFTIFAHSWGSTIGLHYFINNSQFIRNLILCNPGGINSDFYEPPLFKIVSETFTEEQHKYFSSLIENNMVGRSPVDIDIIMDSLAIYQLTYNKKVLPKIYLSLNKSSHSDVYEAHLHAYFRKNKFNLKPYLLDLSLEKKIKLLQSKNDFYTKNNSKELVELLEIEISEISNAGHFPWIENSEEFYTALLNSLQPVRAESSNTQTIKKIKKE